MVKKNVSTMSMYKLYKFSDDSFVWSTMLNETRGGSYRQDKPFKFTEVYRIDNSGDLFRIASGRLIDNPAINDFDHRFSIYDYDKDLSLTFFVTCPFKEANLEDLYNLRNAISQEYQEKNK